MKKFGLLLMIALLVLTSCGNKPEELSPVSYGVEVFDPGLTYDEFIGGCAGDTEGNVYLAVSRINEENGSDLHCFIYSISEDGMPSRVLSGDSYWKEESSGTIVQIEALQAGGDGSLWITGSAFGGGSAHDFLWHVDQEGKELDRFNLSILKEKLAIDKIDDFIMDSENWLYIVSDGSVYVLDSWQRHSFTLEAGDGIQMVHLSHGQAGFLADGSNEVRIIDKTAQDWGEAYRLPESSNTLYPGNSKYLFFCRVNEVLHGWDTEREALVPLARLFHKISRYLHLAILPDYLLKYADIFG